MKEILLIALGGGTGAVLRYLVSKYVTEVSDKVFPWGTMTVNILGCLVAGIVIGCTIKLNLPDTLRLLLIAGFCGGFTTFSAFSVEGLNLLRHGYFVLFASYFLANTVGGLAAVYIGSKLIVKYVN